MRIPEETPKFNPIQTKDPMELIAHYDLWKEKFELHTRLVRAGETPRVQVNLEGSSSSHLWEEAYSGRARIQQQPDKVVTISPLLYERMMKEGHVSELLNLQIRIRRESWPHYLGRILKRLT